MKSMNVYLVGVILACSITSAWAEGDRTRGGGDLLFPRASEAKRAVEATLSQLVSEDRFPKGSDPALVGYFLKRRLEWARALRPVVFERVSEIVLDGLPKLARVRGERPVVELSVKYFNDFKPSLPEVMINVLHEAGHLFKEGDEDLLDRVSALVVATSLSQENGVPRSDQRVYVGTETQFEEEEKLALMYSGSETLETLKAINPSGICAKARRIEAGEDQEFLQGSLVRMALSLGRGSRQGAMGILTLRGSGPGMAGALLFWNPDGSVLDPEWKRGDRRGVFEFSVVSSFEVCEVAGT